MFNLNEIIMIEYEGRFNFDKIMVWNCRNFLSLMKGYILVENFNIS